MKKINKVIVLCLMLSITMLVGCSSKPKVSADETAKILFNFYIRGDKEGIAKINIPKDKIEEAVKLQKDTTIKTIKTNFQTGGLPIKDEQLEELYKVRMEALKKVTCTTQTASQADKTAEVKLKATYIDEVALDKKAGEDAVQTVTKMGLTDQKEALNKVSDEYIKNLIQAYKNAKPSQEAREKSYKFNIQEKTWLPENMTDFASGIAKLALGMQ